LLAALLSLGSLQATTPIRAPFAQVRSAVCLVEQERRAEHDALIRALPSISPAHRAVAWPAEWVRIFNPAFVSRLRFQLPPPVSFS
jgi:hypothetical protein